MSAVSQLSALEEKVSYRRYSLKDVEGVLSEPCFSTKEGLLAALESGDTLLHLVAGCQDDTVLPMVCQTYQRIGVFSEAMLMQNKYLKRPIHVSIEWCCFNNTVYLFKESLQWCPEAIQPLENGWSLFHSATQSCRDVSILRYLLSRDECLPTLLSAFKSERQGLWLPLDEVRSSVFNAEFQLKHTKQFYKGSASNFLIQQDEKRVESAKEFLSAIEQPTLELKAEESKRKAIEEEKKRFGERQKMYKEEMESLVQANKIQELITSYVEADTQETREAAMTFLAEKSVSHADFLLPPFTEKMSEILMEFLGFTEGNHVVVSSLMVLDSYSRNSFSSFLCEKKLVGRVLSLACSNEKEIQTLCCSILVQLSINFSEKFSEDDDFIQMLLLVNKFSNYEKSKSLAQKALHSLGVSESKDPDPGSWNIHQVAFWMTNHTDIEGISEYTRKFLDAGIDGLHLLELSSAEMMGLGLKFVSHQRKLSALIDDLRRMNKSELGKRDVFLSYAHVDIKFARQVKNVLNSGGYSVWMDETGIRAGQKWRNEIADGIKHCSCFLFIMTQRSANSDYCQDEVGLAEEYRKPILTIKLQQPSEIDPGLKLVLYRRQIIDCSDGQFSKDNSEKFLEGIIGTIGLGSQQTVTENTESSSTTNTSVEEKDEEISSVKSCQEEVGTIFKDNKESLRSLVKDILNEDETYMRDTVKEVMLMERDKGVLRQVVQEVIAVECSVGGRLREVIREIVSEELQEMMRAELVGMRHK